MIIGEGKNNWLIVGEPSSYAHDILFPHGMLGNKSTDLQITNVQLNQLTCEYANPSIWMVSIKMKF